MEVEMARDLWAVIMASLCVPMVDDLIMGWIRPKLEKSMGFDFDLSDWICVSFDEEMDLSWLLREEGDEADLVFLGGLKIK